MGLPLMPDRRMRYHARMRLTADQTRAIVAAARDLAGDDARVRLFGSRLRDDICGGDIAFWSNARAR